MSWLLNRAERQMPEQTRLLLIRAAYAFLGGTNSRGYSYEHTPLEQVSAAELGRRFGALPEQQTPGQRCC